MKLHEVSGSSSRDVSRAAIIGAATITHFRALRSATQIAAAPADVCAEMAACANIDVEQEMDFDSEYAPTAEDIQAEEQLLSLMMENAQRWDNFLDYVRCCTAEWPQGELDLLASLTPSSRRQLPWASSARSRRSAPTRRRGTRIKTTSTRR